MKRGASASALLTAVFVAAFANAANPDNQIYDESPDGRFGFRDSFAGTAKIEESDRDLVSAVEVVEISSKRVVLPSPKEALTPIHLRRQPQAWSSDSKHIALNFQTGPRMWTTALYKWDGNEFAQVSWPRDAIRKRFEEEQAAQLKALGLPDDTPRKLVYEGFTALEWVDATAVKIIAERIDSVVLSKDQPPAELDARFSFVVKIRDPQNAEIADATKILGTHGYHDSEDWVEARLVDEQPESSYLVKDVEEGQQPFRLYALERFRVVGEKGNDYVVEDGCNNKGRIPRRLVHKFPSAFTGDELDWSAESLGVYYWVLVKDAESGYLPALRAVFAFVPFDGMAGEAQAFLHEPPADAEAAGGGLDEQQAQLGDLVALAHHHHRAQDLPLALGDPATLAPGVEVAQEFGGDLRHQRLEAVVPAIFPGIERAMAMDDPPEIAGPMRPQDIGDSRGGALAQQGLDLRHILDQAVLGRRRQSAQHGADLVLGAMVEGREGGAAKGGQAQQALPGIQRAGGAPDQAALLEALQKAAEITGIEAEIAHQRARGGIFPMGQLIKDPGLGQGEGAPEQPLLEHADPAGVEAVEAPDGGDPGRQRGVGQQSVLRDSHVP